MSFPSDSIIPLRLLSFLIFHFFLSSLSILIDDFEYGQKSSSSYVDSVFIESHEKTPIGNMFSSFLVVFIEVCFFL